MTLPHPEISPGDRMTLPSYPKAFFERARVNIEADRVFVMMPFSEQHSKHMWSTIQTACKSNELHPIRADTSRYPRPILVQILEEIGRAAIIIADLTTLNPNVLYELGIAHCHSYNVVLIAPKGEKLPFDLAAIRCVLYDPDSRTRWKSLKHELEQTISEIRNGRPPIFLEKPEDRTRQIVADLQTLEKLSDQDLKNETVWSSSFLSILAFNGDGSDADVIYRNELSSERESLLRLARRGCRIKLIINPPLKANTTKRWKEHALTRAENLYKFIRGNDRALRNIDWCISPMRQKNVYVIGKISCIEGFKENLDPGYHLSARQTSMYALEAETQLLESLYQRLCHQMLPAKKHLRNVRAALRSVALKSLRQSVLELRNWK